VHPTGTIRGVPVQEVSTEVIGYRYVAFDCLSADETS